MENQVERFDPSTLMQGVKDRIKVCPQCSIPKQLTIEHFAKDSSRASGLNHVQVCPIRNAMLSHG